MQSQMLRMDDAHQFISAQVPEICGLRENAGL
jgi:hypothetical protein